MMHIRKTTRSCRAGYSLVELMIALPIMTVITAGLCSAIFLASRTPPQPDSVFSISIEASAALERMDRDVRYAILIEQLSEHELVMQVPDRSGDLSPESIRYEWSGNAGDPLIRGSNGGTPEILCNQVQQFKIRATVETRTGAGEGQPDFIDHLKLIEVSLRALPGGAVYLESTIAAMNSPEIVQSDE